MCFMNKLTVPIQEVMCKVHRRLCIPNLTYMNLQVLAIVNYTIYIYFMRNYSNCFTCKCVIDSFSLSKADLNRLTSSCSIFSFT